MTTRLVVASLLLFAVTLFAADPTGAINGVVTDASGAVVANAKLKATRLDTGYTRETVSGADGGYVFPLLPPATHSVSIEVVGQSQVLDQNHFIPFCVIQQLIGEIL